MDGGGTEQEYSRTDENGLGIQLSSSGFIGSS